MSFSLHLLTLNTRGLNDKIKRRTIFEWCKHQNADILFLQETHFTNNTILEIENEWNGGYHSLGTSNSRGTSIMFTKVVSLTLIDSVALDNGRGVLCDVQHKDSYFSLVNIYAPNIQKERNSFFNSTEQWIKEYSQGETIIGGDFNTVYDVQIDKKTLSKKIK